MESLFLTYNHCALKARRLSRNRFCPLPCLFSANTNIRKVMGASHPVTLSPVFDSQEYCPTQVMGTIASAVLRRPASNPTSLHPTTHPSWCSPCSTTCIELVLSIQVPPSLSALTLCWGFIHKPEPAFAFHTG